MSRRTTIAAILLVAVLLGSVREFLFVNLNYQIDHLSRGTDVSYAHSAFQSAVHGWTLSSLLWLKWILAALFIAVMLGLTLWFARVISGSHRHARLIVIGFGSLALIALLLSGLSIWIPPMKMVSVKLLHLLQYPVLLFFVWAGILLRDRATG